MNLAASITEPPPTAISISADGTVSAVVAGTTEATQLGQITVAAFANPAGLQPAADNFLKETGASGPTGNPYGDAAGHSCLAVAGPKALVSQTLETGQTDRLGNMLAFSRAALSLLKAEIEIQG